MCSVSWGKTSKELISAAFWLQGNAHRAQEASDKIFSEMLQSVERWHAEICQLIQANLHAAMAQASHPTIDLPSSVVTFVLLLFVRLLIIIAVLID